METEYLPNTRPSIAATSLPDGESYYAECLRFHTSTDLTPDQIHKIGLDEVGADRRGYEGGTGTLRGGGLDVYGV